jgi:hypothetical protein
MLRGSQRLAHHQEVIEMSKSQDAKKDKKKQPQKSAKEKRQAKRDKRNK